MYDPRNSQDRALAQLTSVDGLAAVRNSEEYKQFRPVLAQALFERAIELHVKK